MFKQIVDLTHAVFDGVHQYPGDPQVKFRQIQCTGSTGYNVHLIEIGSHAGTHLDAPYHVSDKGKRIGQLDLTKCVGEAQVVDVSGRRWDEPIKVRDLEPYSDTIGEGARLLIRTGWDKTFGREEFFGSDSPYVSMETGQWLVKRKIWLLGLDFPSPNLRTPTENLKLHRLFLENGVILVESLTNLEKLKGKVYLVILPLKLKDLDASPVRAIALQA
jgi:kynurenine formamidase